MAFFDETEHQRSLLKEHLLRLMAIDEQLAQLPTDITLRMERDRAVAGVDQAAARLGMEGLAVNPAAIVDTLDLRDDYRESLLRQHQSRIAYRRVVEIQRINADPVAQINLDLTRSHVDEQLARIEQQLALLGAPISPEGDQSSAAPNAAQATSATPAQQPSTEARAGAPGGSARLRGTLLTCDNYFDSNRALRTLFGDARLTPWRTNLPEADSISGRVDLLIDYLRDKRNTTGDTALGLLLEVLVERYDPSDERHAALMALLSELPSPTPPVARAENAAQEAGRRAPMLPVAEAQIMLARAAALAQVSVGKVVDGRRGGVPTGTAWLIAPDLAITCWHVVHARGSADRTADPEDLGEQLQHCLLTFDFTGAGQGIDYAIARLEHAHRDDTRLDYALLRLRDRDDARLACRSPLPLDLDAPLTALSDLFIIQHPGGQPQQQSDGTFARAHPRIGGRILYTNRTEGGTSGAPVFNRSGWRVVALHHGTNPNANLGEGMLMRAICDELRQQRPDLWDEIKRAQPR